jgi:hypothetical protein
MKTEGSTSDASCRGVGDYRVAGWAAHSFSEAIHSTEAHHLPGRRCHSHGWSNQGRERISANYQRPPPTGSIRKPPRSGLDRRGHGFGYAVERPERNGGSPQAQRHEGW